MRQSLPADFAPLLANPPVWDNVFVNSGRTVCCAISFTLSGQKRMYAKGWEDAVDGKPCRMTNPYYRNGYQQGQNDLNNG
jgi:hypothetical protein